MIRLASIVLLSGLWLAAATAASGAPRPPQPPAAGAAPDPFPETTGKSAVLKVCSHCHAAENVIQTLHTRQEWSELIDQMSRFGAEATDQEYDQILAYLSKQFSPIRINKAAAKDLEAALDVPAAVAEAIVAYRLDKGDFETVEDLAHVPGLERATIEARKARIVF